MFGTPDGAHQLTFEGNGDWLPDPARYVDVAEAESAGLPRGRPRGPGPGRIPPSEGARAALSRAPL